MTPLISLRDVRYRYSGREVLSGVDLIFCRASLL